jgi:hypothetical protein
MEATNKGDGQMSFQPGDIVLVNAPNMASYEGEIVRYWRNGAWMVREFTHDTECAHYARDLTNVDNLPENRHFVV